MMSCPFGCGDGVDYYLRSLVHWSLWTWTQDACQLWDVGTKGVCWNVSWCEVCAGGCAVKGACSWSWWMPATIGINITCIS